MAQVVYNTRVTNLTSSAQVLPAPYGSTVPARGNVIVQDPVSVVVGNLSKLPSWQLSFWQVSVVESSPTSTVTTAPLDLRGQRAINAANPLAAQDLTTKSYVDAAIAGVEAAAVQMGGDVDGPSNDATVVALRGSDAPVLRVEAATLFSGSLQPATKQFIATCAPPCL